jgi:hypothetical protein
MQRYKPQWLPSPINLPERRVGRVKIRHRLIDVGESVSIVGMRQALLRGQRPVRAALEQPLRIHELVEEDHGIWMTDLPEELNQIAEMLHTVKPRGRVLVGGLGLGLVAAMVTQRRGVRDVVVVERNPSIIKLCANAALGYRVHGNERGEDIGAFLRYHVEPFDYYLLDTWQGTNEGTWWKDVLPLRRIIRQRWGKRPVIHCWAEDIMLGQIIKTLTRVEPHWYYRYLPVPMPMRVAQGFVAAVGLPTWEELYGAAVDAALREEAYA